MKIAMCVPMNLDNPGGVETHIIELGNALRDLGIAVDIFSLTRSATHNSLKNIELHKYDIIHTHGCAFSKDLVPLLGSLDRHQKHVHTLHGISIDYLRNCRAWTNWRCYWSTLIEASMSRHADLVITVSQSVYNSARRYFALDSEKLTTIYNGYLPLENTPNARQKIRSSLNLDEKNLVLVFVGRSEDRVKGADIVIDTMSRLYQSTPKIRLLAIPGRGFPAAPWLCRCNTLPHNKIGDYYAAGDIFVNTSRNEGLPLTLLEAMACPLPVIAAPVGGIPEIIRHGENGLLLKRNYSDLGSHIKLLADNPSLRHKLARQAQRSVSGLSWPSIARQTCRAYRHLVEYTSSV